MATKTAYSRAVAELNASAQTIKRRREMLRRSKALLSKVARRLQGVSYTVSIDYDTIGLHVYLPGLEGFKEDRRLLDVLDRLVDADKIDTRDWPDSLNRDYHFTWTEGRDGDAVNVKVTVAAYVRSDSPTCHKVLVGSKLVEQKEYRMVCD